MSVCIYIYNWRNWYIKLEITMTRKNPAHTYIWHTEHWTVVTTLLGLISSAHRDLHHRGSNQQPLHGEAETLPLGHWFMLRINDTELTSHRKLRDLIRSKQLFSVPYVSCRCVPDFLVMVISNLIYIYIYIYIHVHMCVWIYICTYLLVYSPLIKFHKMLMIYIYIYIYIYEGHSINMSI